MNDKSEYLKKLRADVAAEGQKHVQALTGLKKASSADQFMKALGKMAYVKDPAMVAKAMAFFRDKQASPVLRIDALRKCLSFLADDVAGLRTALLVVSDKTESDALREQTLNVLKSLSFSSKKFAALRSEYMAALRPLLDDADAALRETAAEELAKSKDEYVQRRLLAGLKKSEPAIVDHAKAIQLLGYDIHAEHYPVVRGMLSDPAASESTKVEAIHVLAGDPESKTLLLQTMQDKKQGKEVRMTSAMAVQSSNPKGFVKIAKPMIVDESEEKDMRAACLNALMHHRDASIVYQDAGFVKQVRQLLPRAAGPALIGLAKLYLKNAGRHGQS